MQVWIRYSKATIERRRAYHTGYADAIQGKPYNNEYKTIQRSQEYNQGYEAGKHSTKTYQLAMLTYYEIPINYQLFNYFAKM